MTAPDPSATTAFILAAGIGRRLHDAQIDDPKCLIRIDDQTLLHRHLDILRACRVSRVVIAVGYQAQRIEDELARVAPSLDVSLVHNNEYSLGSVVSLWCLREHVPTNGEIVLMDADVLYDVRMLRRLLDARHENCLLIDRDFEPGDEPVKVCLRQDRIVEFRKHVGHDYDVMGESVGFFRLSAAMARRLVEQAGRYVADGRKDEPHEEALRAVLLAVPDAFGCEDVTGLPWIEIDFPEDLERARREIFPRLEPTFRYGV